MRWFTGWMTLALTAALSGCSEEVVPIPEATDAKVRPTIYVVNEGVMTKADGDLGSTYWTPGDDVGFLLLDNSSHALYTDTKGHIRYTWDGSYWSTEEGHEMNAKFVAVYCFYPFPLTLNTVPDGIWTDSWLPVETATNTDYLWGTMIDYFKNQVNGPNPDVSMVMYHALARVSFRLKRAIDYIPGSTVTTGSCSSFKVSTKQSSNSKSMRGAFKYSLTTGNLSQSSMTYDDNKVAFSSLEGHTLAQTMGSTIGETTDFMSVMPVKGTLTVEMTVDGQSYTVTLDPYTFKAGYHYVVNLEYTGTQINFVSGTGAAGSGMEITPWSSAGNINVKGSN